MQCEVVGREKFTYILCTLLKTHYRSFTRNPLVLYKWIAITKFFTFMVMKKQQFLIQ